MTLYGSDLLKQIYAAYLERYQKALERGYDVEGERYHWLYNELLCRVQRLREALLYMEALPHFLSGADEDHALQYIMGYTSRLFRPENIGSCERDENQEHPFFRDSNPYWRELQEAMDAFNDPEILSNRPLLYVYACELITRAHRLYLQIRERFLAGEMEKGREIQNECCRIIYKMCSAHGNMYAVIKAILVKQGGPDCGSVRLPLAPLTADDQAVVDESAAMIAAAIAKYC